MIRPVILTWTTTRPMHDVRGWFESSVVDTLRRSGYRVDSSTPDELALSRSGTQWVLLLISLLAFWLSDDNRDQVVFKFQQLADGRSQVYIVGDLPGKVADILQGLTLGPATRGKAKTSAAE